jgi:hypothetical protein
MPLIVGDWRKEGSNFHVSMRGIETNFITIVSEACNKNFTRSQLTSILAAGPSNAGLSGSD